MSGTVSSDLSICTAQGNTPDLSSVLSPDRKKKEEKKKADKRRKKLERESLAIDLLAKAEILQQAAATAKAEVEIDGSPSQIPKKARAPLATDATAGLL